jgi:ABC-type transport system involved in cytochrome c biogenesis permease subunit
LALFTTAISALLYIRNFFSMAESERLDALASDLATVSFALLCLAVILQWFYLGVSEFGVPFATRTIFTISLIGFYLLVESIYSSRSAKVKIAGMFVMPGALLLELYAWAGFRLEHGITPALQSGWVAVHVVFAVIAYGAFTTAFVLSILHLIEERRLKKKVSLAKLFRKFPSLETLENLSYKAASIGFIFLSLVIIAGIVRAEMLPAWQKWYMDPKIIAAIFTWIVYGFYVGSRWLMGWRGHRSSILLIIGYCVAIFTYFVNNILESIHSYGEGF